MDKEFKKWLWAWFWKNYTLTKAPKALRHAYLSLLFGSRKVFKGF